MRVRAAAPGTASAPGDGLRVVAGGGTAPAGLEGHEGMGVPELVAEAALLQARLDWFQAQPARLGERGGGGAAAG